MGENLKVSWPFVQSARNAADMSQSPNFGFGSKISYEVVRRIFERTGDAMFSDRASGVLLVVSNMHYWC